MGNKIQDHNCIYATITVAVPATTILEREVWNYSKADWQMLKDLLEIEDWNCIRSDSPDTSALYLTETNLRHAKSAIGKKQVKEIKSTHPWLTKEVKAAIKAKHSAASTDLEREVVEEYSRAIMTARENYIKRVKR